MKKTISVLLSVVISVCMILCFSGCKSDKADENQFGELETYTDEASMVLTMSAYIYGTDGIPLKNTVVTAKIGEEETEFKTDYMGYINVTGIKSGEEFTLIVKNESATGSDDGIIASERITVSFGNEYSFDDKEKSSEKLTVLHGNQVVSAKFSITSNGNLNCTELY